MAFRLFLCELFGIDSLHISSMQKLSELTVQLHVWLCILHLRCANCTCHTPNLHNTVHPSGTSGRLLCNPHTHHPGRMVFNQFLQHVDPELGSRQTNYELS